MSFEGYFAYFFMPVCPKKRGLSPSHQSQNQLSTGLPCGFVNLKNDAAPSTEVKNNMAPIGTAVDSSIPTSGDTIEPSIKGSKPMTALALPAR